jgi:hypothetical protein
LPIKVTLNSRLRRLRRRGRSFSSTSWRYGNVGKAQTRCKGQAMMRRVAVVGDQLDTGGEIEHYAGPIFTWGDSGHQVAVIGGSAYCTTCGSSGVIARHGGARRMKFFQWDIALDGDHILCNCASPPRIAAKLSGESWCDDGDPGAVAQTSESQQSVARHCVTYDERYTFHGDAGEPLANARYRIITASGRVVSGITNRLGETERIATGSTEGLRLFVARDIINE